ncbi:hypothetical protein [Bacillus sp. EAC]|uniref:hypothetical protein n=1 Tax=Bacillus sp. EAC TaxID=1978338 RepID=UPI000B4432A0|nr:hypothetical protein [Bacillus sp. EAC]
MRKLMNCLILFISMWCILFISSPGEAATVTGSESNINIAKKLKNLQSEVKSLNKEKENLNDQIDILYPKKKKKLVTQLKDLETSDSLNKQSKLNKIQKEIDIYKEAITKNNNLKAARKKLWEKYKKQKANDNLHGAYKTLKLIRQNLIETIENNKAFLEKLSSK